MTILLIAGAFVALLGLMNFGCTRLKFHGRSPASYFSKGFVYWPERFALVVAGVGAVLLVVGVIGLAA